MSRRWCVRPRSSALRYNRGQLKRRAGSWPRPSITGCTLYSRSVSRLGYGKGELLALRWDEIDLDDGVLHVRQNVQRLPEMGLVFGPPKSNKSRRTIPLPAASARVLRTHRANHAAEALALGPAWVDSGLVFTSTVGTVIEPRNLNRFFDELITKAGVRRIRFHDLRHTCASLLLAQNVPARVVMEILGHSQLAMTTDLYSHVMPTALRAAADAMDRVLVQPN
jgi:integrase